MKDPTLGARLRLSSLWLSQTTRVLADNCLRMVVVLAVARAGQSECEAAWHKANVFFILPFLMFIFCMALGEDYNQVHPCVCQPGRSCHET